MRLRRRKNWQRTSEQLYPGSVCKPGESTGSSGHDGPGDLRRYRCEGRYLCGGSRNRRYLTGVGEYLKSKKKDVEIVAVEPKSSAVLSEGIPGAHKNSGNRGRICSGNFKYKCL